MEDEFVKHITNNFEVLKQKENAEFEQIKKRRDDYLEKLKLQKLHDLKQLKSKQGIEMQKLLNQLKSQQELALKSISENWMTTCQENPNIVITNASNQNDVKLEIDDESVSLEVLREIDNSLLRIVESKKRKADEDKFRVISKQIINDVTKKAKSNTVQSVEKCEFWSILDKMGTSTDNIYPTLVPDSSHEGLSDGEPAGAVGAQR